MNLLIDYKCYNCGHKWQEVYSCACDSECTRCDAENVSAIHWREWKGSTKESMKGEEV